MSYVYLDFLQTLSRTCGTPAWWGKCSYFLKRSDYKKKKMTHLRGKLEFLFFLLLLWFDWCLWVWFRRCLQPQYCLCLWLYLQWYEWYGIRVCIRIWTVLVCVKSSLSALQAEQRQQVRVQSSSSNQVYAIIQRKNRSVEVFKITHYVCIMRKDGFFGKTVEAVDI